MKRTERRGTEKETETHGGWLNVVDVVFYIENEQL